MHQNPEWPAKDIEVSVSSDGKNYAPLAGLVLPERSDKGANFLFAIKASCGEAKPATTKGIYLKKVSVSSTMGVGVRVDQGAFGQQQVH